MKKLLLLVSNLCFALILFGQGTEQEVIRNVFTKLAGEGLHEGVPYYAVNNQNMGAANVVSGSAYLDDQWQEGLIMTQEEQVFRIQGRYNAQGDEMQVLVDGKAKSIFPNKVKGISLGHQVFVPKAYYQKEQELAVGWFEVLTEGNANLFQRYFVISKSANYHPVLGAMGSDVKFVIQKEVYYSKGKNPARKLKKGRTNVLEVLQKRQKAVNEYARKYRLKFSKTADLVALFEFYNGKNG